MRLTRARRLRAGALFLFALLAATTGCKKRGDDGKERPSSKSKERKSPPATTNPDSVVRDIEARIRFNESKLGTAEERRSHLFEGAKNHLTAAQFLGQVSSYGRAAELAATLARKFPSKKSYLLLARVSASLHDWKGAQEALELARKHHADFGQTADVEAQLATARGNLQRAMVIRSTIAQKRPRSGIVGSLAVAKAELGDIDSAEELFADAISDYVGPSPLTLAWLHFQRGLMWERAGRPARAAEHYQSGVERFPRYAPLVSHLAANLAARGQRERAIELLEPIAEHADDPQYRAQLGELLLAAGDEDRARELIDQARAGYAELLDAHPMAFADHAIGFYIGAGRSPHRALELARALVRDRPVDRSYQLLLRAAEAADKRPASRCELADGADQVRYPSAQLHALRARAYRDCKQPDRARQALAAAKKAVRQQ